MRSLLLSISRLADFKWAAVVMLCAIAGLPATAQDRYELQGGQWQKQPTYPADTPEGKIQIIRKNLAKGDAKQAESLAKRWIDQYPNHPLLVEARLLRGDARVARNKYYKSLYDYEYVIRTYPGSEQFHIALQREFEIANLFIKGMNRKFLGLRMLPADGEGEELLVRIQERAPGSELGEAASLTLADYYYEQRNMTSAADAYDLFLLNYPQSEQREWAMLRLIQANLARFKGPQFDPTGLIEAAQRLKAYRQAYPAAADRIGADALLVRIDESLATKHYLAAKWHRVRGEDVSAAYIYERIITDYPQTSAAELALQELRDLPEPILRGLSSLHLIELSPRPNQSPETDQPATSEDAS